MPKMTNNYLLPGLITNRIPPVHNNTFVLGLCGVDLEHAGDQDDGWFLSDFYAFNYILKGRGAGTQAWLAAVQPRDIVNKFGSLSQGHGGPYGSKTVLSGELLAKDEITIPKVVPGNEMVETFFQTLQQLLNQAKTTPKAGNGDEDKEILIMIFGHTQQEDNSIAVDYSSSWQPDPLKEIQYDRSQLSLSKIQATVADAIPSGAGGNAVRVTLLTPASYSGGWSIRRLNPDLNTTFRDLTSSQPMDTPGPPNSAEYAGDDSDMGIFKKVFRQLIDVLDDRNPLYRFHGFFFCHGNHQDRQLSERWHQIPSTMASPKHIAYHTNEAGEDFGKATDAAGPGSSHPQPSPFHIEHLFGATFSSQLRFVRKLAISHLNTCMGDWERGWGSNHYVKLRSFINEPATRDKVQSILQYIEWKVASMDLTDVLVRMLNIPRPSGGSTCQSWDLRYGVGPLRKMRDEVLENRVKSISKQLREERFQKEVVSSTRKSAFPVANFDRPLLYMAGCMALGAYQAEDISRAIRDIKHWRYST